MLADIHRPALSGSFIRCVRIPMRTQVIGVLPSLSAPPLCAAAINPIRALVAAVLVPSLSGWCWRHHIHPKAKPPNTLHISEATLENTKKIEESRNSLKAKCTESNTHFSCRVPEVSEILKKI